MQNTRRLVAVTIAALALAGCESELRRALNDVVDQREAGAEDQVERYREFESELIGELGSKWEATRDAGCPIPEPLPQPPDHGPMPGGTALTADMQILEAYAAERERRHAINLEVAERQKETWVRTGVPARQCKCLQETLVSIEAKINEIDLDNRFAGERERLDSFTEEELPDYAAPLRASAEFFGTEAADQQIERWASRRDGNAMQLGWGNAGDHVESAFETALAMRWMPGRELGDEIFRDCARL